ncbi:HEAT repeat domain-containing protein [Aeoliella sp. SH292]|uniref:HEAT repeat domain-containing protein n=1 Tax=Aeoliella sp. SH292 TaxID=3454464 RepID=UPI003F964DF7
MLQSPDVALRRQAAEHLSQNPDAAMELPVDLVKAIGDSDRQVMEYAVATLEELGEPSPLHLSRLSELIVDENPDVQYWAVTLVGRTGPAAVEYATRLAGVVASKAEPQVRERAAWAIARIGPAASPVRRLLEPFRDAEPSSLARAVRKALEAIE